MTDILLEKPVKFEPLADEWLPVDMWSDLDWEQWLLEHNRYPFLRHWSDEEVARYLNHDRFYYGFGVQAPGSKGMRWFYNPTPIAVPFHASKIPNILFGGAAGGSKSHSARWDAIRHCFALPEFRAIIMRRTFEELKRNHLDKVRGECERLNAFFGKQVMVLVTTEHEVRFEGIHGPGQDSKIIFGHCQNVGDEEKYLGDEYDAFYPDEMATFEKKQIIGVAGRLRSKKRGVVARLGGTSNPGGAHTLWLKDWFIDKNVEKIREENPRYNPAKYQFLQAMLYDNPYFMDPDGTYTTYEDRLFAYDEERRRQLLMGDWSALAGQFFPEFSDHRHVAVLDIPPGSKIERWIDWGYDPHYGVCLWVAHLPGGRLYVFYEWKFNGANARQKMVASEVAHKIRAYTVDEVLPMVRSRRISHSLADPSMWSGDGHSGEDYAETFGRFGVSLTKADNERVMGWGRLRHWFKLAPDGRPWLMFHPRCTVTARTIPTLIRDKNDPDDVDTSGEDHPADCLRYGVMGRPTPKKFSADPAIIIPGTIAEVLSQLKPQEGRPSGMVS